MIDSITFGNLSCAFGGCQQYEEVKSKKGKRRRGKRLKGEMGKGERRAGVILIPLPSSPFAHFPLLLFPFVCLLPFHFLYVTVLAFV
jgi:hypothetical protein